jgi:hypothetical protein
MAVGKVTLTSISKLEGYLWDTHVGLWRAQADERRVLLRPLPTQRATGRPLTWETWPTHARHSTSEGEATPRHSRRGH